MSDDDSDVTSERGSSLPEPDAEGYRLLAKNSTDMVMRSDLDGNCVYVSPACERLLGYAPEEMILGENGEIAETQSSSRDVTARVLAEQRLRWSEELHRSIAENLPNTGIFLFDRDLRLKLTHGNPVNELPWFSDRDFQGRTLEELIAEVPAEIAELSRVNYAAALEGESREFSFESSGMSFEVKAVPIRDEGGDIDAILVVAEDVTERKRSADALEDNARRQPRRRGSASSPCASAISMRSSRSQRARSPSCSGLSSAASSSTSRSLRGSGSGRAPATTTSTRSRSHQTARPASPCARTSRSWSRTSPPRHASSRPAC